MLFSDDRRKGPSNRAIGSPQPAREHAHNIERKSRRAADQSQEILLRNRDQRDVGFGDSRGAAQRRVDQRHLAENVSRILNEWMRLKLVTRLSGYYCIESRPKLEKELKL